MANNGYRHENENDGILYADDLTIGQRLIQIQHQRWSDSSIFIEWTVARLTKTRLVLERPGSQGTVSQRVIVRRDQFSPRGLVTRKVEGMSEWSEQVLLHTADSPAVAKAQEHNARAAAERAARSAAEAFVKSPAPETARAAMRALQAYQAAEDALRD